MNAHFSPTTDAEELRRRVTNWVYQRLAFTSFVIWTAGCLILFILYAANSPRPVFPAMMSMTVPLIPAFLVWILYRPLIAWQMARHLPAGPASQS
jgi:hypothetical protein